jgi:ABC-type glutathione transport system ATPase component
MTSNLPTSGSSNAAMLRVRGLSKQYWRGMWPARTPIAAVTDVAFEICAGKTLALVGASGSGKSTVARCVVRLETPDAGQIWFDGTDIARLNSRELLPTRRSIQMIFQDATTAMNPRFTAAEVIQEPLRIQGHSRSEQKDVAEALMKEVALSPDWLHRPVMWFSGGQRQRLAIARALTLRPKLLVLDEGLSGLDLSVQSQVANLLVDLQQSHSLTYLLISHDLAIVSRMAEHVGVLSGGRIVEQGPVQEIFQNPKHDDTKLLLAAAREGESRFARSAGASA